MNILYFNPLTRTNRGSSLGLGLFDHVVGQFGSAALN